MKKKLLGFMAIALVLFGCQGKNEKTLSVYQKRILKEINGDTTGFVCT